MIIVAIATERDKQLKRELIEENLSFVTVSHLTRLIQGLDSKIVLTCYYLVDKLLLYHC